MLDILRSNARSALTYVLFGIIIVVFIVSFGPGSCGQTGSGGNGQMTEDVAKVNGERISAAEVEQWYGQLLRNYQQQVGDQFSREVAESLGFRKLAVDQLVEHALMVQEAKRQGIVVSDEEVERAIKTFPAFQANGRFDYELYQRSATATFGSPARFEERMRADLLGQRIRSVVRQTAKVSESEVREAFERENDRVSVEFVRFALSLGRSEVQVAAADVDAFAAANGERIQKFYEDNKARFEPAKKVKARHVLAKAEPGAPEDAAKAKAEQALARAKKGEDFAKIAKDLSDDVGTKDRGGDLGAFGPGTMVKEFEDAAFAAKPGDVVGPVRTPFGFHVIKVDEVQEPKKKTLDEARPEIARELLETDRAKELAKKRADEALAAAKSGKSLQDLFPLDGKGKAAVKWGGQIVRPEQTGPFGGVGAMVPRVGPAPELARAALGADGPKLLEQVFETEGGPVVARVVERQKADAAQFEAKKGEIAKRLRDAREREVLAAWMKTLREGADIEMNQRYYASAGPTNPQQ